MFRTRSHQHHSDISIRVCVWKFQQLHIYISSPLLLVFFIVAYIYIHFIKIYIYKIVATNLFLDFKLKTHTANVRERERESERERLIANINAFISIFCHFSFGKFCFLKHTNEFSKCMYVSKVNYRNIKRERERDKR